MAKDKARCYLKGMIPASIPGVIVLVATGIGLIVGAYFDHRSLGALIGGAIGLVIGLVLLVRMRKKPND